jgi:hypothetical protein
MLRSVESKFQQLDVVAALCVAFLFITFSSCENPDDANSEGGSYFVQTYDDEITEVLNSNYKITASSERYFMIYQVNLFGRFQSILLTTDLSGELIKRDTLPAGIIFSDVLALDDGSALVAGYLPCCSYLNFFRYDKNGNKLSSNSLYISGIDLVSFASNPQLTKAHNGNIIVYGDYYNAGFEYRGYMTEVDLNGNVLWSNKISLHISSCASTPDNGYLFASSSRDTVGNTDVYLVKTNATGDSLFAKKIKEDAPFSQIGNLVHTARNSYQVSYTEQTLYTSIIIYECNLNGDSLNAVTLNNTGSGLLTAREDGRTLLTVPSPAYVNGNAVSTRTSTKFLYLDADLNLTEKDNLQNVTTDFIISVCNAPDERLGCFGVIQPFKREYYNPVLIVLN